jgi:hypothetical protein
VKKILILLLTVVGIININMVTCAYGPGPCYPPPPDRERWEARQVLEETKEYIFRAERVARGYQRADLRRAYELQAEARDCYRQWYYRRAIRLSYSAREIAQEIIRRAEEGPPPPPYHHHHHDDRDSSIHIRLNL